MYKANAAFVMQTFALGQPFGKTSSELQSFEIKEEESTDVICPRKESSPLPELLKVSVCKNKDFSTEGLNRSTTQEELKKAQSLPSLIHESKTNNNNKRSKEGFLQYLGSLFGISSKSSYKEKEPSNFGDGHCKTKQGFSDQGNHQDKGPTDQLKSKIFAISNLGTEQNISSKDEDSNLRIKTSPQHLQKPQDQSAETAKFISGSVMQKQSAGLRKTISCADDENAVIGLLLTMAAVATPAKCSATGQQQFFMHFCKKQADLEQKTVTRTSISHCPVESKKEEITNNLSLETTKEPESLLQNGKYETKYDKQNSQENMLWSETNQKEDIQGDCERNELKNKITFLREIETIENCIEELESVKCASVSDKSEINRKLLLEPPAFLPNQVSSSYQNTDSARINSENSRLDEKRKALEEIHMQLQSNNVSTVCFKKETHLCVFSNIETKEAIQNEFSSYPEEESTNNDHQLLEDKYSWTDDQLKLESVNPSLYMNSHNCSDQINNNEELNTDMMTENHPQLFLHKPAGTEELPLVFKSGMSALSTENGSELLLCSKSGLESKETTEPLLLRDLQNNSRISIMANIGTSKVIEENFEIPVVELDAVLSNGTEENKANISLLDTKYTHVDSFKTDASNVPQSLEAKNDCYPVKRNENKTLIQPLNSLNICSSLEKQNKLFELENMRHVKNTDMSSLKTTKIDAIKTQIISEKTSNSMLSSIRNHVKPPDNKEFSCLSVISSKNECLKPDKTNLPPDNSSSLLPVLISNANIFEDNIHLDTLVKSASNSKDQNFLKSSYFLPDEQEYMLQSARVTTAANSAEADFSEICYSDSVSENSKAVLKSHFFLESGNNFNSHIMHDTIDRDNSRKKILPHSNETKYLTSSYSMDSESILIKESFPELTSDNVHVPKSAAIPTTSSKDTSDLHSPACEAVEAVFDNINSLHINSEEDTVKLSSKDELSSLSSESISDVTYSPPLVASVTYYMDTIDSSESEMPLTIQQCKEIHTTPSGQNSNCLKASPSKIATSMDKQAIAALFSKSSNQFFKEPLKNVETGKQLQIKSQNLTLLFKKADEIVDEVLHLAIEEIRSKQTAYICQNNDTKYNESPSFQKDHTNKKMMSESKKMQSGNSSLKPFNVNDITKFTGLKFDNETQNEKEPLNITDKTDLHNSVTVKPKEITDSVIKTAKQNPAVVPYEKHLSQDFSQNTNMCYTKASEILITDAELSTKLSEIIEIPLNLSPVSPNEEQKITVEGVTNVSVPFNFKEESEEVSGEIIPKNMCSGQTICEEWYDDITKVNSSPDKINNAKYNKDDDCTINRAIVGDVTSSWICENQCNLVKGEAVKSCKQLSACSVLTRNVLPFNSNINAYGSSSDKYKDELTYLCLSEHNIENDSPPNEITAITAERKEPHQKYYEINSEWGSSKMGKEDRIQQDTKFNVLFNIPESTLLNNSSNIGFVHGEIVNEDPCLIADNVLMEYSLHVDSTNENKSPNCSAFPTPKHWEHNSSFNILYKDSFQDESYSFSGEEIMSTLSHPDLSLDNKHKMYETSRFKDNLFASYDESKQLTEMLGDTCSESFMTLEAKRYRIYPFSLSPIYEDDGSQEDLPSTDISPKNHYSGSPRENQSLSVLSLLQSVSEKLKSSNQYNENEQDKLYEEKNQEEEKEISISSIWQGNKNTEFPKDFSRQFISKEVFHSEETSSLSSTFAVHFIQKSDPGMKPFLKDTYSENLPGLSYLVEKGNTLGSRILPADPPSKSTKLLKLVTCQKCPIDRDILKCNSRPGKMLIYDFHGNTNKLEIYRDVVDATLWIWILYEKPTFQGQKYVLEEGERMLTDILNLHREKAQGNFTIGSIRHITKDCSIPEIELCSHNSTGHFPICMQTGIANLDELEVENPIISVKAGVWLAYSDTDYKGEKTVLEENQSPCKLSATDVKSFRPLKMGGLKVQMPMNTMMIIYERPHFGGWCKKLSENTDCIPILLENSDAFQGIGSIRVIGGMWVAYQQKYFCGEQYILEKGKYKCFLDWGGTNETIMSIRPIKLEPLGDHQPTHWIKAFDNIHFQGSCIDFTTEAADFTSFIPRWLLYYQGKTAVEQCVLEEDLYPDLASCGCSATKVKSLKPVDHVFAEPLISLFALENCEGKELHLQEATSSVLNKEFHFLTQSIWVKSGIWIAYEGCNFLGKQFLLESSKISNWTQFSGWKTIGSLRPIKQPAMYFRIKNRSQEKYLTVAGSLMDGRATSVCLFPQNGKNTQIWHYSRGLIKSKVNDACLDVIGGRDIPGAKEEITMTKTTLL
ncbi:Beta/gamma crystallin domain-containing protein 3, partial [Ophiophagus hannah]